MCTYVYYPIYVVCAYALFFYPSPLAAHLRPPRRPREDLGGQGPQFSINGGGFHLEVV